jgi:ribosomal protein L40E
MTQQSGQNVGVPAMIFPFASSQAPSYQNIPQQSNPSVGPPARQAESSTTHWRCRYCGDAYQTEGKCSRCGQPRVGKNWKCFGCGKETNVNHEICYTCNAPKDLGLYLVSIGVNLTETRQQWVCRECNATTPLHLYACSNCKANHTKVRDAMQYKGNPSDGLLKKIFG